MAAAARTHIHIHTPQYKHNKIECGIIQRTSVEKSQQNYPNIALFYKQYPQIKEIITNRSAHDKKRRSENIRQTNVFVCNEVSTIAFNYVAVEYQQKSLINTDLDCSPNNLLPVLVHSSIF